MKSDSQFLFTAPVMIPNRPDCDYNRGEKLFSEEDIRFFKESFQDYQIIDKNHQVFLNMGSAKQIGDPIHSFILEKDTTYELIDGSTETYPRGTWMLTTDVTDPVSQQEIEDGILTGYSLSVNREEIGKLIKKVMAIKSSRGELIKDIPNPNAITVSIVRKPCQSGSKQCKLKGDVMSDDKKTLDKIRNLLGGEDKPEYATKEDFDALAKELKENNAALKSLTEDMGNVGKQVSEGIADALSELGSIKSKNDDDGPEVNDDDSKLTSGKEGEKPPKNDDDGPGVNDDNKKKKRKNDGSKQGSLGATKSNYDEELDTYAFLGRKPDGTVKRQ